MKEYNCHFCKKTFNPDIQKIKRKGIRKLIKCPYCNAKYELFAFSQKYARMKNGQLINKNKVHHRINKKERLKLRKVRANELASNEVKGQCNNFL